MQCMKFNNKKLKQKYNQKITDSENISVTLPYLFVITADIWSSNKKWSEQRKTKMIEWQLVQFPLSGGPI